MITSWSGYISFSIANESNLLLFGQQVQHVGIVELSAARQALGHVLPVERHELIEDKENVKMVAIRVMGKDAWTIRRAPEEPPETGQRSSRLHVEDSNRACMWPRSRCWLAEPRRNRTLDWMTFGPTATRWATYWEPCSL